MPPTRVQHGDREAGYMLLAVVVMTALVLIALSVAAPVVARDLRRDKELESEHRAQQYVRAIQLYYRKTKGYPPSIKALENTNNVRFLRKQYIDPLTGEANWRLIHQGEQKTKITVFFGQELSGLSGGLGAASNMQSGTQSTTVHATGLGSGFNDATIGGSAGTSGSTGASGSTGSSSGTGMFGDNAAGGIIVGVGTARTGNSVLTPAGQETYETWEFWYDPRIELLKSKVSILGGGISSQPATSFGGSMPGAPGTTGSTGPQGSTGPTQ